MRFSLLFIILLLLFSSTRATTVSVDSARMIAIRFFCNESDHLYTPDSLTAHLHIARTESDGVVDFYVFDIEPDHGFVIVSATDVAVPILGYSSAGSFHTDYDGSGIDDWMGHLATDIHSAVIGRTPASARTSALWTDYRAGRFGGSRTSVVHPLVSTTWGQVDYYDQMCPYDSIHHAHCYGGCVATAMAQVMKYWSYPETGIGSFTYTDSVQYYFTNNIGVISVDVSQAHYEWSKMPHELWHPDTAINQLLYHCGVAARMDYGVRASTSTSQLAIRGLARNFGYDSTMMREVNTLNHNAAEWLNIVKEELDMGRPMLYFGIDTGNLKTGHEWVCDGYDSHDMLHMNWGWSGIDDGYYAISDMDPLPDNFTISQGGVIGIQPTGYTPVIHMDDDEPAGFRLYPDPAAGSITISANTADTIVGYTIYDILGRDMISGSFVEPLGSIALSSLPMGVYVIRLDNGATLWTRRFSVSR